MPRGHDDFALDVAFVVAAAGVLGEGPEEPQEQEEAEDGAEHYADDGAGGRAAGETSVGGGYSEESGLPGSESMGRCCGKDLDRGEG